MKFGRLFFFFNDTATTEIYTLSLHDALPISIVDLKTGRVHWIPHPLCCWPYGEPPYPEPLEFRLDSRLIVLTGARGETEDRKSTRLNSSHANISYAVFCLKKKKYTRPIRNVN